MRRFKIIPIFIIIVLMVCMWGGDALSARGVGENVPASGVRLNRTSLTMGRYTTEVLTASVHPPEATNKEVIWETGDEEIVEIEPLEGRSAEITALSPGKTEVTVITVDGGWRISCAVEVVVPVENIYMDQFEITLAPEEKMQFEANILPKEATDQRVSWESSNNSVVQVDGQGLVTAKREGTARVVARSVENQNIHTYCTVTVTGAPVAVEDEDPVPVDEVPPEDEEPVMEQGPVDEGAGEEPGNQGHVLYMALGAAALVFLAALLLAVLRRRKP